MNNPDHISNSLEIVFWVKILKFFDGDPGSGIRDGKNSDPGWKNSDPQHWDDGSRSAMDSIGKTAGKEEYDVLRYFEMKMSEFCRKFKPPMPKCVMGTAFHYFKVSAFNCFTWYACEGDLLAK
jgi:hypothetical protein